MTLILYFGAENETRTRDPNLGKVMLYQLSYFRIFPEWDCKGTHFFETSKLFCKNFQKKFKKVQKIVKIAVYDSIKRMMGGGNMSFSNCGTPFEICKGG